MHSTTPAWVEERDDLTRHTREVFGRYHAAWESGDADRIAALHSDDGSFWLQDGPARIHGRDNLRKHYAALFARYGQFGWDERRLLFGSRHWVFDYEMLVQMTEPDGSPLEARIGMVDVVDINDAGEVIRKDVFLDRTSRDVAFSRAGLTI